MHPDLTTEFKLLLLQAKKDYLKVILKCYQTGKFRCPSRMKHGLCFYLSGSTYGFSYHSIPTLRGTSRYVWATVYFHSRGMKLEERIPSLEKRVELIDQILAMYDV